MTEILGPAAKIAFLDSVEHSFIDAEEKAALTAAAADGVTPRLWNEFNDKLIEAIVRRREAQMRYTRGLDGEIDRFTAAYEKEKGVLDLAHRAALDALEHDDAEGRARLWEEYYGKIRALQGRLVEEVRRTSTTVLHDVILATVADRE
ncbi:MAG TPA: hypothetical protein VL426_05015 [Candidatus Binatia bacterium]|jgi:hypothetical protein|nr:hypothetical protein [Candidatus Binatia bacterium]